jgi:hypothetical protein
MSCMHPDGGKTLRRIVASTHLHISIIYKMKYLFPYFIECRDREPGLAGN